MVDAKVEGKGMRYIYSIAFLCVMTAAVEAQTYPTVPRSSTVPTGVKRQIGFFTSQNADCTTNGDIQSRLTKAPANGTVELDDGPGYPFYVAGSPLNACNSRQVMGVRVMYTSKDGYTGKDSFESQFFTPTGAEIVWKYSVTVK
jgi:hypothetical protein